MKKQYVLTGLCLLWLVPACSDDSPPPAQDQGAPPDTTTVVKDTGPDKVYRRSLYTFWPA